MCLDRAPGGIIQMAGSENLKGEFTMIDYDLDDEVFDFIKDTNKFFEEFNRCNPVALEVKNEDRIAMSAIFLLSRISDSLKNIENAVIREKENGKF